MTIRTLQLRLAAGFLTSLLACSGGEDVTPDAGNGNPDATVVDGGVDAGSGDADATVPDAGFSPECEKQPNLDRIDALTSAQPVLEARSRDIIQATISWNSLADDPQQMCSVELEFKDSNGNGSLDAYENWTLTPAERAADLVGRMTTEQKLGLMLHPTSPDEPSGNGAPSSAFSAAITGTHVRFARTDANASALIPRATWANEVQAIAEAEELGIPVVLSMAPAHSSGNGRVKAVGFSQWPAELGLGATDAATVEEFGTIVSQEYRAIGVRMALSPSADLATDPRWFQSQFTFGEDGAAVAQLVAAYVRGLQGETMGPESVAAVVGHFPGAGAAKDGWDARLAKGKLTTYPGDGIDEHLLAFETALAGGVAGVMPGYAIPEQGSWSGAGGLLNGATIEQVGASFNAEVLTDVLREHYSFGGLVLAPWGVLEDVGLGAPWGVETLSKSERVAKAIDAGVDQFGGLADPAPIAQALGGGAITQAQVDASAARALVVMFGLGLFEDPYIDPAQAPAIANNDNAYKAGLRAMNRSLVLLHNVNKPAGWLDGDGDGTQTGDKGNAGNGSLKVLPAPPGEPYISAGCAYYVAGNIDLDYVRSVSQGYGLLTNDVGVLKDIPVNTAAERMALSDYIFIRIDAPFSLDGESGSLELPTASLEYAAAANAQQLAWIDDAKDAIESWTGAIPSQAQIVVVIDSGRPSVVQEVLAREVSGLYLSWIGKMPENRFAEKVILDVAFGIVDGEGTLPVGLPLSDAAAASQNEDVPGDGQHETFTAGYGLSTPAFE